MLRGTPSEAGDIAQARVPSAESHRPIIAKARVFFMAVKWRKARRTTAVKLPSRGSLGQLETSLTIGRRERWELQPGCWQGMRQGK